MPNVHAERGHIYGEVNSIKDIRELNRTIRQQMDRARTREQLTELKKRSDYLCTLTFSPAWKTKFGEKVNRLREVATEENRQTVRHANEMARRHGWPTNYDPWGEPAVNYKPSQARYDVGGNVKYLVYRTPQRLANGRVQMRTRVKRVYFPGDASNIAVGKPGAYHTIRGRKVFGVPVTYRYVLAPATAHRGKTMVRLPKRAAHRTKIVPLPKRVNGLRFTSRPPKGPLQAVA